MLAHLRPSGIHHDKCYKALLAFQGFNQLLPSHFGGKRHTTWLEGWPPPVALVWRLPSAVLNGNKGKKEQKWLKTMDFQGHGNSGSRAVLLELSSLQTALQAWRCDWRGAGWAYTAERVQSGHTLLKGAPGQSQEQCWWPWPSSTSSPWVRWPPQAAWPHCRAGRLQEHFLH